VGVSSSHFTQNRVATTTITQTMDLLVVGNTQSLAKSLHEFLEYQKCIQQFNEVENKHKDLLKHQRFGIAKHLKEFDMANARKIEAIK
jgi:hypothetical protein